MVPAIQTLQEDDNRRRILLYGDINLNVLDGSAVWLISMAEALSKTESDVWVLLKAPISSDRLVKSLGELSNVTVVEHSASEPTAGELSPRFAARRIFELDSEFTFDIVVTRGFRIAQEVARFDQLLGKCWIYITDLPFPSTSVTPDQLAALEGISRGAKRLFAQTEDARSYLEGIAPNAAGKTLLLPPMIPDEFIVDELEPVSLGDGAIRLVYSGKFAKDWRTLEMCELVPAMAQAGKNVRLTMIGDKFQDDRLDPSWPERMRGAIRSPDVDWLGGRSRSEAMTLMSEHHVGLGWRSPRLDSSLEISTKLLEYGSSGVAPVMNRTAAHEELFGADYPLFINGHSQDDLAAALDYSEEDYAVARRRAWEVAASFSMSSASRRLEEAFQRCEVANLFWEVGHEPLKVVLAGHDFKFSGDLIDLLRSRSDIDLRIDKWETLHKNDDALSQGMVDWADVVICEWAGPNSAWYSTHKRPRQKLIIRLHAFELGGPWLNAILTDSIDSLVCVSHLYAGMAAKALGLSTDRIVTIPNAVDSADLFRPKQSGAKYRLGLVGIVPFIKRPDRALNVLRHLLDLDDRYSLHVKGRMPWEYAYEWNKPVQREAYLQFFGDIGMDQKLAQHVAFEPFGADMGSWLRKIGFILSPSTRESFHLAPAEGMASGSVPIFWSRPGVVDIFGNDFLVDSDKQAAEMIHRLVECEADYEVASASARKIASTFDLKVSAALWLGTIFEGDKRYAP
jgi:glycosyltransferase involved in cell wall biosynthesis